MSEPVQEKKSDILPAQIRAEIDSWVAQYPEGKQRSATVEALRAVQHENGGWLSVDLMDAVADYLDLEPVKVYEVATFYSMFETEPVGRHSVSVCTNISCMLRGAYDLVEHIEKRHDVKLGESTQDNRIYFKCEEECLAACAGAPMMMVDHKYYENLDTDKVDAILDELE